MIIERDINTILGTQSERMTWLLNIVDKLPSSDHTELSPSGYVYLVNIDPESENEFAPSKIFSDKITLRDFVKNNYNDITSIINVQINKIALRERLEYLDLI